MSVLDRRALCAALRDAGLPPESFQIPGVHECTPTPTDFWFLRPAPSGPTPAASGPSPVAAAPATSAPGGWEIGSHERGHDDIRERFATEAQACARLYTVLTGHPPQLDL